MSERRACWPHRGGSHDGALSVPSRARQGLRERMRELAAERRRFGYRRLHVLLRRGGLVQNRKRTQRLYREEGLAVRRRRRAQARHRLGRRCSCRPGRTRAGRSTSCTISSPAAAASAS